MSTIETLKLSDVGPAEIPEGAVTVVPAEIDVPAEIFRPVLIVPNAPILPEDDNLTVLLISLLT